MLEILQTDFFSSFTFIFSLLKELFSIPSLVTEVSVSGTVRLTQHLTPLFLLLPKLLIKSPFGLAQPRRGAKIHLSSESWEYSTTISPSYMHPHIHKGNNMLNTWKSFKCYIYKILSNCGSYWHSLRIFLVASDSGAYKLMLGRLTCYKIWVNRKNMLKALPVSFWHKLSFLVAEFYLFSSAFYD